ncbi:ion channel protein [Streptomyces lichenis]|uniref:Ion channel protein n=1 Tax=Streptomyces lichenis TaxID=2306967 RepID=A0ABT0I8J4_9ACTN|nr:ion channel protein [Streptomyces lichenis]MCK8677644.1 ion channel protein [Streptomyces lichenis]
MTPPPPPDDGVPPRPEGPGGPPPGPWHGWLPRPARLLLPLVLPALLIGAAGSLVLLAVTWVADRLEGVLWSTVPRALGLSGTSGGWTVAVLTAAGLAVGLAVWRFPGGTGPDPATRGLVDPPLPPSVLPGVLVAAVIGLASGVSLGPENPITSVNVALAVALGMRALPKVPGTAWAALAAAGTVGAMFGTPVAAALLLSEVAGPPDPRPLWDRLFAPLVAAGAGALTTVLAAAPTFALDLGPRPDLRPVDGLTAMAVASVCALVGLVAVALLPYSHRLFHRLRHPVAVPACGGLVLGLLGVLGGRITLFKGSEQMRELTGDPAAYTAAGLALIVAVKLVALVVAASCGFQGGRIFPAVFIGVALGMLAHAVAGSVPLALAVPAAVLGVLLATTRQGWLSLFMAAVVGSDIALLPLLCVAALPAWLLVTGRPLMQVVPGRAPAGAG